MLAPLLDKMVDSDPSRRFSAEEALHFFEEQYEMLDFDQLEASPNDIPESLYEESPHPESFDRWVNLPHEYVKKYDHLRVSKVGFGTKLLRYMCRSLWMRYFVQCVRRVFNYYF